VDFFGEQTIKSELGKLAKGKASENDLLRLIPSPLRLEFLSCLWLKAIFPKNTVIGNYKADDEGVPTSHAPGGHADIELHFSETGVHLYEVSLIKGRNQVTSEMIPITRHYDDYRREFAEVKLTFVAPTIHPDAVRYSEWISIDQGYIISTSSIENFALS
jgi:hypothetical protein